MLTLTPLPSSARLALRPTALRHLIQRQ